MPTLGIIGSGNIGAAVARLAVAAGIPVVVSNSRGPQSLAGLIAELGPLASAGTVEQAAQAGDLVVLSHHIPQLARPSGAADRTALPVAGDHAEAKADAATLIDRLGFDTVDAGPLAQSWRFEPEAAAYTRLYLADPATPAERMLQAPGRPVPAAELRRALQTARRVSVADRAF